MRTYLFFEQSVCKAAWGCWELNWFVEVRVQFSEEHSRLWTVSERGSHQNTPAELKRESSVLQTYINTPHMTTSSLAQFI